MKAAPNTPLTAGASRHCRYRRRALAALLLLVALTTGVSWFACPPPLAEATRFPSGVIIRDAAGGILRVGLGPADVDCRPFYAAATNDWIVKAVMAAEDHRFFRHRGVDPLALMRAVWQNLAAARRISGASTLTMQTVRLIHPRRRTWRAKYVEAFQALRLERAMTKTEILGQYLNRAPFGSNLVGIESAARGWFNRPPRELTLGEAALLAGMVQSPTRFRPDRKLPAALKRRDYVLARMEREGMITAVQRAAAVRVPLTLSRELRPFREPWFCDWVQRGTRGTSGTILTTLDPALQQRVNASVNAWATRQGCHVAAVVLKVADGSVAAMGCSGDYFDSAAGQVNTAVTPRPAGSTLKPFLFAQAIDQGRLTPAWVLADVPRHFGNHAPANFSGDFLGLVTAEQALVLSLNLPALALADQVGLPRFLGALQRLGFAALDRPPEFYGLGLVLGNGSVSLLELANACACLARGGLWRPCRVQANAVLNGSGTRRVFSEGASWLVSEMLSGDARAQDAVGHVAQVVLPRFAWKTGTSAGNRDAWTVAWNPEWVIAVWCGDKRGGRGPETRVGKEVAAPLAWQLIRDRYPDGRGPWFRQPDTVTERRVCQVSGRPAGALCRETRLDFALKGCSSSLVCPVHQRDGGGGVKEVWAAEIAAGLQRLSSGVPGDGAGEAGPLTLLTPADGTRFRRIDGMSEQRIAFKVAGGTQGEPLYWFLDGRYIGLSTLPAPFFWEPVRGTHQMTVSTAAGSADCVELRVD